MGMDLPTASTIGSKGSMFTHNQTTVLRQPNDSSTPLEGTFTQIKSRRNWRQRNQTSVGGQPTAPNMLGIEPPAPNMEPHNTASSMGSMFTYDRTQENLRLYSESVTQGRSPRRAQTRQNKRHTQNVQHVPTETNKSQKQVRRLILPSYTGEKVTEALEAAGIAPEDIGLKGAPVTFASEAALLRVSPEDAGKLEEALKKAGLQTKEAPELRPWEFRIHRIPANIQEDKIISG